MFLDILDPIDKEIILKKNYETEEVNKLLKIIKSKNITNFVDIGANCGYYSFIVRKYCPKLNIYSFEPNKRAFIKLKKTKNRNVIFLKNFKIYNFGLSNKNSNYYMFSQIKYGQAHTNSSISYKKIKDKNLSVQKANFKKGDQVLNLVNKTIAIKIDVEGHELEVLKGIKRILKKNKCTLLIEIAGNNFKKTNNYLNILGYKKFLKPSHRKNYFYKQNI